MSEQLRSVHRAALEVTCPYCGRGAGFGCYSKARRVQTQPHPSRISLAHERGHWK